MSHAASRTKTIIVSLLLVLSVVLVFGQTLGHDFVTYDDQTYIYEHPLIRAGLTAEGVKAAFTRPHSLNWHPLTTLSHMLDCQLFGVKPQWHHAMSIAIHAAAAVILFLVFLRMTGRLWPSAFVAAVFAVHPLRVESVAWIAERKDVLSGLFFALTLAAYERYCRRPFSIARYSLVVACFALGLMAKPMLVTLPFVLLLLDYWPLRRLRGVNTIARGQNRLPAPVLWLVLEKVPLVALSAASCAATLWAQGAEMETARNFPLSVRVANAAISYVAYLGQMLWPANLAALYPHPVVTGYAQESAFWYKAALSATVLAAITAAVAILHRRFPWLLVGWLWYVGMLAPVIGLAQVGWQSMADRYTYLPHVGLTIAVAWTVLALLPTRPMARFAVAVAATAAVAAMMLAAWNQTSYWRDSEALWSRVLACTTRNAVAHTGLGRVYQDRNDTGKAIEQYELALKINPVHLQAHNNLGAIFFHQWEHNRQPALLGKAIEHYSAAVRAAPNYARAHNNLGACYWQQNKLREAIVEFREALKIDPDYPDAKKNLTAALQLQAGASSMPAP